MRHIVTVCCFCEKVRDDAGGEPGEGLWVDFASYRTRYVLKPEEVMFSHTYCPACLVYYRDFLGISTGAAHRGEQKGTR